MFGICNPELLSVGLHPKSSHTEWSKLIGAGYTHLEALLVKQGDEWLCLMEYQKAEATQEEWDALK